MDSMTAPVVGSPATFIAHASAVQTDGMAWVFLGPSGIGKSTICRLLNIHTEQIADDWTYFAYAPEKSRWGVTSADIRPVWPGAIAQSLGDKDLIPLQAIFQLQQASHLAIEPVNALHLCHDLLLAFYALPVSTRYTTLSIHKIFSSIASVARSVTGYQLSFSLSSDIFNVVQEKIRGYSQELCTQGEKS